MRISSSTLMTGLYVLMGVSITAYVLQIAIALISA